MQLHHQIGTALSVCQYLVGSGVLEVVLRGVYDAASFRAMSVLLLPSIRDAGAAVIRCEEMRLEAGIAEICAGLAHGEDDTPAAFVVSAPLYVAGLAYAATIARRGAVRVVFSDDPIQTRLAYSWARRHRWMTTQKESPASPRCKPWLALAAR